ncbi:hypothetical protein BaRGS_00029979 [Batillaria attramentaria]|uniref:Uncharacterized protein n=1 Tax=Batillaria attramentaria TaxID=370345 RepID=A0ABD0JW14_9CAEN
MSTFAPALARSQLATVILSCMRFRRVNHLTSPQAVKSELFTLASALASLSTNTFPKETALKSQFPKLDASPGTEEFQYSGEEPRRGKW